MATKIYLDINKSCVFDTDGVVETIPTGSLIMRKDGLRVRFNYASTGIMFKDLLIADIQDENGDAYADWATFESAIKDFFLVAPDLWGFETLNHANATFQTLAKLSSNLTTDAESEVKYPNVKIVVDALADKQDVDNLSNDLTTDASSTTKYPAVKPVVDALGAKQDTSNLSNDMVADAESTEKYPSVAAVLGAIPDIDTLTTLGSDATGDIYYRDATGHFARLAAPTVASVLKHSGVTESLPYWEAEV